MVVTGTEIQKALNQAGAKNAPSTDIATLSEVSAWYRLCASVRVNGRTRSLHAAAYLAAGMDHSTKRESAYQKISRAMETKVDLLLTPAQERVYKLYTKEPRR